MLSQVLQQKQQLRISPHQIQLLNIFFLNRMELEMRINNELEENPFLETSETEEPDDDASQRKASDTQDYQDWDEFNNDDSFSDDKLIYQSYISRENISPGVLSDGPDFKEDAKQQLRLLELDTELEEMAAYIIDMLNDNGLLDSSLDEIAEQLSFRKQCWIETENIGYALSVVQTLEPIGIGSISIKDCLLKQLNAMKNKSNDALNALKFIEYYYDDFISHRFDGMRNSFGTNELKAILKFIAKLNFYPISNDNNTNGPKQTIVPDFIISIYGGIVDISICSSRSDSIFINHSLYEQLTVSLNSQDKLSKQYMKSKLTSARWFVSAVKQRENTMLKIMSCIAKIQREYLIDGDSLKLKPMTLRIISESTGLSISTISRIINGKYAQCHLGIIHLKKLFSEGISNCEGKVISNKVIRSAIYDTIAGEDRYKPYTDLQIVNILSQRGYKLARRTVTKYRQGLDIPIAHIRNIFAG